MSDFIDRQDAIDAVHKELDEVCVWDESGQTTANEVENILYEVPSAKPERKTGKWIDYPECLGYEGAYNDEDHVCSECHAVFNHMDNCMEDWNFCPNCGARLEWK